MRVRVFYCMYRGGGTGLRDLDRPQPWPGVPSKTFNFIRVIKGLRVCACAVCVLLFLWIGV